MKIPSIDTAYFIWINVEIPNHNRIIRANFSLYHLYVMHNSIYKNFTITFVVCM